MRHAALVSAGCSALFVLVYAGTNALAAARGDLPTFHFDWELAIPRIPWMVVPYMSIDLLFIVVPFLCASSRERTIFARRVGTAILIAGICFVLWPLQPAFARTPVEGPFAPVFEALWGFDQPHNLFPSLHVALGFILRWTYHRHLRGRARLLMHAWMVLVTASTLFTHQHHVIDVLGGGALGLFVFYLYPTGLIARTDVRVARAPSRRWAVRYAAGSALLALLALGQGGWAALLLGWAALALAIVALGYGPLGPRVFRKYGGYLSAPSRILLAPYLVPLGLTRHLFWRRQQNAGRRRKIAAVLAEHAR
ncbi:MAG: phosphatase PAP2 family protein, partial [Planctomycetota bacterium]